MPVASDQKIAAGDYLEYRYTYTDENETVNLNVRYTFTSVTTEEATVNMVYDGGNYNLTVNFNTVNNALAFTWPNTSDNAFDIFDFMYIMNDATAEKSFTFQNVGANIILMNTYTVKDISYTPWWTSPDINFDEVVLMVKMGTNIPIYMELSYENGDLLTTELVGTSMSWVALI